MYMDNLIKVDERVGNFPEKFCGLGFCSRMTVPFWNGAWTTKSSSNLGHGTSTKRSITYQFMGVVQFSTTSESRKTKTPANLLDSPTSFPKGKNPPGHSNTLPFWLWSSAVPAMAPLKSVAFHDGCFTIRRGQWLSTGVCQNNNHLDSNVSKTTTTNQFEKGLLVDFLYLKFKHLQQTIWKW